MSKSREPFRLADRHFISFDSALLFGQPQNDSIERTRRPGGGGRDCPAQCCDEYDTLFRHLTHAACRMPVALSAQFNRLSLLWQNEQASGLLLVANKTVAYFVGQLDSF